MEGVYITPPSSNDPAIDTAGGTARLRWAPIVALLVVGIAVTIFWIFWMGALIWWTGALIWSLLKLLFFVIW
jgi:hypothetical protein